MHDSIRSLPWTGGPCCCPTAMSHESVGFTYTAVGQVCRICGLLWKQRGLQPRPTLLLAIWHNHMQWILAISGLGTAGKWSCRARAAAAAQATRRRQGTRPARGRPVPLPTTGRARALPARLGSGGTQASTVQSKGAPGRARKGQPAQQGQQTRAGQRRSAVARPAWGQARAGSAGILAAAAARGGASRPRRLLQSSWRGLAWRGATPRPRTPQPQRAQHEQGWQEGNVGLVAVDEHDAALWSRQCSHVLCCPMCLTWCAGLLWLLSRQLWLPAPEGSHW